jgi:DNA-binding transcriptional LysR family regulator
VAVQLAWLRTFVSVYRLGSFTRAAQALGLSQPAVTQQIKNLEKETGRTLFDRVPNGARPTAAAEGLLREVEGPIDALGGVVDRNFGAKTTSRTLVVGGPVELMTARVIPSVSDMVVEGTSLRFVFGLADDLLVQLADGEVDLVLSTVRPRVRGVVATPLADEEFLLVASPSIAAQICAEALAADAPTALAGVPMISYGESLPIVRRYWRTVFGRPPTMSPGLVVPDLRGALAAVKASAGISVLPSYLCADELERGEVVALVDPEQPPINTFYLAVRSGDLAHSDVAALHGHLLLTAQTWA